MHGKCLLCSAILFLATSFAPANVWAVDPLSTPLLHDPTRGTVAYLDVSAFAGNTVVPVTDVMHTSQWAGVYAPTSGTNYALATGRLEAGVERGGYHIGYALRQEWFATANRPALDAYEQSQNGLVLPGNPERVKYSVRGWSGQGLRLGRTAQWRSSKEFWRVTGDVSINLLEGQHFRAENWAGSFTPIANGVVLANGGVSRNFGNMQRNLVGGPVPYAGPPEGWGYSIDFAIRIATPQGYHLDWTDADAVSAMRWRNISSETFTLQNYVACQQLSAACAIAKLSNVDLATGRVVARDFTTRLPSNQRWTIGVPIARTELDLVDSVAYGLHFPGLAFRDFIGSDWSAGASYDIRFRAVGLEVNYRWLYAAWESNVLNPSRARTLAISMGARVSY